MVEKLMSEVLDLLSNLSTDGFKDVLTSVCKGQGLESQ